MCLCLKYFLAINDGGDEVGLCHPLDIVVQEVAVIDRHVGEFGYLLA